MLCYEFDQVSTFHVFLLHHGGRIHQHGQAPMLISMAASVGSGGMIPISSYFYFISMS
jgi:hypothetical protein